MSTKKKRQPKEKEDIKEVIDDNHFRSVRLNIKDFKLTDKQKSFAQIAFDKNTKIIFINGPAGSSKTFLAVYCALHMLNMNPRAELKYIRTIAESGERGLGSLPGTVDEKFNPFMMPLYDKLDELLPMSQSKYLETNGFIEALPINFLRGATWNDKVIIADESQNYSTKELVTLLTRIGEGTKMFICGDAMQSDIGNKSGFTRVYDLFNNKESEERGIYCFQFDEDDIMRSEILKYIVHMFKKLDKVNNV
jgi:phosphate starvation-inducible PhoH-like protein